MTQAAFGDVLTYLHKVCSIKHALTLSDRELLERFIVLREDSAFSALVKRHGPLVLATCKRILSDTHLAEDAFQATFVILARRAASIRKKELLAAWLYRVTQRIARKAQMTHNGERMGGTDETEAIEMSDMEPLDKLTLKELRAVMDEEIAKLPDKYREPILLCYFEGKSHEKVAKELGCPKTSVTSRLARGREILRQQLIRRGISLSAGALTTALAASSSKSAVSAMLTIATVKAARSLADGGTLAAAGLSARAITLAEAAMKGMFWTKAKSLLFVVALSVTLGGMGLAGYVRIGDEAGNVGPSPVPKTKQALSPAESKQQRVALPVENGQPPAVNDSIAYSGVVVGPNGRPVAGAKLYLAQARGFYLEPFSPTELATTASDGRFKFTVAKAKYPDASAVVAAVAPHYGVGWQKVLRDSKADDLKLHLVNDDVPITGQIINLEGKAVGGATLRVLEIDGAPGENLGHWLEGLQVKSGSILAAPRDFKWDSINLFKLSLKVTTDAEGHFRLTGIGRNRRVRVQLEGPVIASQVLHILTRLGNAIEVKEYEGQPKANTYYGANFRHVAAPTMPVTGVVRDKDTGKPLAGVLVESNMLANDDVPGKNIIHTTTDARGRYILMGLPKGTGNKIRLVPPDEQPYLSIHAVVPEGPGLAPVTLDFELKRGIWIEGKLSDKVTGKPVQAFVDYFALESNSNVSDHPGFAGTIPPSWGVQTKEDGSFRVVGLPGPGLVAVFNTGQHQLVTERDDEFGTKVPVLNTSPRQLGLLINYVALAHINPDKEIQLLKRDITLDPVRTFKGRVLGPDKKPVAGAKVYYHFITYDDETIPVRATTDSEGRFSFTLTTQDMPLSAASSEFSSASDPLKTGQIVVKADGFTISWHLAAKQIADLTLQVAKDDTPIEGRILNFEGKPLEGLRVSVLSASASENADLSGFVKEVQRGEGFYEVFVKYFPNYLANPLIGRSMAQFLPKAVTDSNGKFSLHGFAKDQLVELRIEGDLIETQELYVLTKAKPAGVEGIITIPLAAEQRFFATPDRKLVFWNAFDHAAPPGQIVIGTVRDEVTNMPIPAAIVESYKRANSNLGQNAVDRTVADANGHFRLTGLPRGEGNEIRVRSPRDFPYLPALKKVPPWKASTETALDVGLQRGVWVDVTIKDKSTRKPVTGLISYFILPEDASGGPNRPFAEAYDAFMPNRSDGTFRFAAAIRRAVIAFRTDRERYPIPPEAATIQLPSTLSASNFQVFAEIAPKASDETVKVDWILDRGGAAKGKIVGPDDQAIAGSLVTGLHDDWSGYPYGPLRTSEFTAIGLKPNQPRLLCFSHEEKKLAGSVVIRDDEKDPVIVKLVPWATVSGRLLDDAGKPIKNATLYFTEVPRQKPGTPSMLDTGVHVIERSARKPNSDPRTDDEGRFRAEGLVPGLKYNLALYNDEAIRREEEWRGLAFTNLTLQPGEAKDLGDVKLRPFPKGLDH